MRRLAQRNEPPFGVASAIGDVLDRRLLGASARPVAIALSGGGDSVALLLATYAWANRTRRRLLVLTVDHGLRPESADWTRACAARCWDLGVEFRSLPWLGGKPATGLPAAAREARHRLLADAARAAGARVILLGHTADDVLEAQAMRAEGATTPSPREWAPSPAWPQGRGVFLLRPMLGLRRAAIRDWLTARGERWIEDPANDDLTYARARARRGLTGERNGGAEGAEAAPITDLARGCRDDAAGMLTIGRDAFARASEAAAARFVSVACLCAAGSRRPAATLRAARLAKRVRAPGAFTATLAGARVEAGADEVRFMREAGEIRRGGLATLCSPGGVVVWDGRYEIETARPAEIGAMAGRMAGQPQAERVALRAFAAAVRPTLPLVLDEAGARIPNARVSPLALGRLHAACGLVEVEPA